MEYLLYRVMEIRDNGIKYIEKEFNTYISSDEGYDRFFGNDPINISYLSGMEDVVAKLSYLVLRENIMVNSDLSDEVIKNIINKIPLDNRVSGMDLKNLITYAVKPFLEEHKINGVNIKDNVKNIPELEHLSLKKKHLSLKKTLNFII